MDEKIKKFSDLRFWQEGHILVIMIYKVTKFFPKEEQFGLISRLRRAVVSVTSNVAEGFGRDTMKDKVHFYIMAFVSVNEVQNQLLVSKDIGFLETSRWNDLEERVILVSKMLNGLIKKSKSFIVSRSS